MAKIPESTKSSLHQRLRARDRWPGLSDLTIRHHGQFAYVTGHLPDVARTPDELTGETT